MPRLGSCPAPRNAPSRRRGMAPVGAPARRQPQDHPAERNRGATFPRVSRIAAAIILVAGPLLLVAGWIDHTKPRGNGQNVSSHFDPGPPLWSHPSYRQGSGAPAAGPTFLWTRRPGGARLGRPPQANPHGRSTCLCCMTASSTVSAPRGSAAALPLAGPAALAPARQGRLGCEIPASPSSLIPRK